MINKFKVDFQFSGFFVIEVKNSNKAKARVNNELMRGKMESLHQFYNVYLKQNFHFERFKITDILETGTEYKNGLKDFDVHFLINGYAEVFADNKEKAEKYFNDFINQNIHPLEMEVLYCGILEPEGYVQKVENI